METFDVAAELERLAERYGLRFVRRTRRYVGLLGGTIVEAYAWDGAVHFQFTAPGANTGDQILANFAGFERFAAIGLPTDWLAGVMIGGGYRPLEVDDQSCRLSLDAERLAIVGPTRFAEIPAAVTADLQASGAAPALACTTCGVAEAAVVGVVDDVYRPLCDACRETLLRAADAGGLRPEFPVRWRAVGPTLAALTVVGGWTWGHLQQPEHVERFGVVATFLPAAWAYGLCRVVHRVAGGVNRTLRVLLFASVVASVLAGNIQGLRAARRDEELRAARRAGLAPPAEATWTSSIDDYVRWAPANWRSEAPFLIGGLLGAWIGLWLLRRAERVTVE